MNITVIRHGESVFNARNLVCGRSDCELTSNGVKQALDLKEKIGNKHFDFAFCSPLKRAIQTFEIINPCVVTVIQDERLIERDYADFEGVSNNNRDFIGLKWHLAYKMPGVQGESIFQMVQRIYNFLDELIAKYYNCSVLIVCHCGVCRIIHSYFNNMTIDAFKDYYLDNCECEVYEV